MLMREPILIVVFSWLCDACTWGWGLRLLDGVRAGGGGRGVKQMPTTMLMSGLRPPTRTDGWRALCCCACLRWGGGIDGLT